MIVFYRSTNICRVESSRVRVLPEMIAMVPEMIAMVTLQQCCILSKEV